MIDSLFLFSPEHDWHPANGEPVPPDPLLPAGVLNVDGDGRGVGQVPQPALVRGRLERLVHALLNV